MYDKFVGLWGNNIKRVTKFGGECVALIAEFEAENNLPIVWGDAHTWINNPIMLLAYNWTTNDPTNPSQLPKRGDIIIWPLPNEHIAFYDRELGSHQMLTYGQNSGGPKAHFQPHSWTDVAGWYSLQPATPAPLPRSCTYQDAETKVWLTNKQPTNWYGLNSMSKDPAALQPSAQLAENSAFEVAGYAHHVNGYTYAMTGVDYRKAVSGDYSTNNGINILDLKEKPVAAPYTPPAAPAELKPAEKIVLQRSLRAYDSAFDAIMKSNTIGMVTKMDYYVWETRDNARLIGISNMHRPDPATWINIADNILPPAPIESPAPTLPPAMAETIKDAAAIADQLADPVVASDVWKICTPLKLDIDNKWVPMPYVSTNEVTLQIRSFDGKSPATLPLPPRTKLNLVSTFQNGKYARDDLLTERHRFYALPFDIFKPVTPKRLDFNHDSDVNISDFIDYANKYGKQAGGKVIAIVKNIKTKQFIDGIVRKVK